MVARAVKKISNFLEARNIPINDKELTHQVEEWYWNADISSIDVLCGCVIEYGQYDPRYTRQDMLEAAIIFKGMEEYNLKCLI